MDDTYPTRKPMRSIGRSRKAILCLLLLIFFTCFVRITENLSSAAAAEKYLIGISTLVHYPSLDAVQDGLKAELNGRGYIEGTNLDYIVNNANGQIQLAATIANDLVARNPNVIVAITTPMAQAVVKVARGPVVFAAVTDPVGAGLVSSLDKGEPNVTGTSDAWPYEAQLELIREIIPAAKRLGVLFNPGDAASQYGMQQIGRHAPALGFTLIEGGVNSTIDVLPVARGMVGRVDALFLSSDNTVLPGIGGALQVARQNRLPLFGGDSGTVQKGSLGTVSVGYLALGHETGKLVVRVLRGERNIPTFVARGEDVYVNLPAAELMGVKIPDSVRARAVGVFQTIE
jgi:putative ABC transport system substrate-binding protein